MNRGARLLIVGMTGAALFGCDRANPPQTSGPIRQRGYLWQRDWTPAVEQAFLRASTRLDGVIILGGEIVWEDATPRLVRATIRWETVAQTRKPCALALRIAPYRGTFATGDANAQFIANTAKTLLAEAANHGANISEFQLDYDCPQKKLEGYAIWVKAVRAATRPLPLSITALPSWLDEPAFPPLVANVDDYVLQVHSVPAHGENGAATLCDSRLAQSATEKAARLGHPFSVALPTYRCLAGYDDSGNLLGVAMDSVQPAWPHGTRILEFAADAPAVARLVSDWKTARPAAMNGLIWYRIPTDADVRNWRWPTLTAVMEGRAPMHKLEIRSKGENPVDLFLVNNGEAEEELTATVTVKWTEAELVSSDALSDWTLSISPEQVVFAPTQKARLRLLPGEQRGIGWLRYDRPIKPIVALAEEPKSSR